MTDYANAPAPHGALFDTAPAPTWFARSDTATVTPATRISQIKGGQWVALDVMMQYGKPVPLALALRRVENGRTVFVAREDAAAVLEAVTSGKAD